MTGIVKDKLAEECEAEILKVIYDFQGRGLKWSIIDIIVSQVIKSHIDDMKDIESNMNEADKVSADWSN